MDELREESERSREALASTVGELRDRLSDTASELKTRVSPRRERARLNKAIVDCDNGHTRNILTSRQSAIARQAPDHGPE